ncbi:MAG: hypothetical protein JW816_02585 [Candidatus Buchananbacteria bacterium]|nr:hypothetical protein [Candidatus Buchananbacteria bacterium]
MSNTTTTAEYENLPPEIRRQIDIATMVTPYPFPDIGVVSWEGKLADEELGPELAYVCARMLHSEPFATIKEIRDRRTTSVLHQLSHCGGFPARNIIRPGTFKTAVTIRGSKDADSAGVFSLRPLITKTWKKTEGEGRKLKSGTMMRQLWLAGKMYGAKPLLDCPTEIFDETSQSPGRPIHDYLLRMISADPLQHPHLFVVTVKFNPCHGIYLRDILIVRPPFSDLTCTDELTTDSIKALYAKKEG